MKKAFLSVQTPTCKLVTVMNDDGSLVAIHELKTWEKPQLIMDRIYKKGSVQFLLDQDPEIEELKNRYELNFGIGLNGRDNLSRSMW